MTLRELQAEADEMELPYGEKENKGSLMLRIRDARAPDQTVMTLGRFKGTPTSRRAMATGHPKRRERTATTCTRT